jgi:tRNA pseudouridine38-40 synthase
VNLVDEGDGNYRIEILLKGALYKMVRNMVGTALDVCKGRLEESSMLELLHGDDMVRKNNKSKPAPPEGLTLENVFYDVGF